MRWVSFTAASGGPPRLGAVAVADGSWKVLDVGAWARSRDAETPADLVDLVESSLATQERVAELVRSAPADGLGWVRSEEVRLLAPLRAPNSLRRLTPVPDERVPTYVHLDRRAVVGPGDALTWPAYTRELVCTPAVAAVVGRRGVGLTSEQAHEWVFGYTLAVVWSAPELARDHLTALGPWVVSPDEWCPQPGRLPAVTVDGRPVPLGTAGSGRWSFGHALSWASQDSELWPTDVLVDGGPVVALEPGQRLVVGVEGLGELDNQVMGG